MAKKSKLLAALDAHKGRDYEAEKRKKQMKAAEKKQRTKSKSTDLQNITPEAQNGVTLANGTSKRVNGGVEQESQKLDILKNDLEDGFEDFSEDEDDEMPDISQAEGNNASIPQPHVEDEESVSEAESDVPLSELSSEDRADTIPHQRMTINNGPALLTSISRVRLLQPNSSKIHFSTRNTLISTLPPATAAIPDPNDDLTRELEFYRICREAATIARTRLLAEGIPFTRPGDYFAEMVKSDEHMGKVRRKIYDEAASRKAASEARALRDARKFGKAVQVAKEQERAKEKKSTLDKINLLKRKRKGQDTGRVTEGDDLFQDIDVEEGGSSRRGKDGHQQQGRDRGAPGFKRQKRDQKYGFGGKKRFAKSGDAVSTADIRGFSAKGMKSAKGGRPGTKRPGKGRRAAGR